VHLEGEDERRVMGSESGSEWSSSSDGPGVVVGGCHAMTPPQNPPTGPMSDKLTRHTYIHIYIPFITVLF